MSHFGGPGPTPCYTARHSGVLMRLLALLLLASLVVFTLGCEDSEPEAPPVPAAASTSIPTQTPDMSSTVSAAVGATKAVEVPIDATAAARVEATKEPDPTPTLSPHPTLTPDSAPAPTPVSFAYRALPFLPLGLGPRP